MRSVFFCCLPLYIMTGMMAVREERNCFFEAVRDLLNLKTMVGYESDIKLYCPDLDNIKVCWKENLQCFNAELNVLNVEFDGGSKQKVTQLIATLKERFDVHLSYLSVQWIESATLMGIVLHVMALEKACDEPETWRKVLGVNVRRAEPSHRDIDVTFSSPPVGEISSRIS